MIQFKVKTTFIQKKLFTMRKSDHGRGGLWNISDGTLRNKTYGHGY